MMYRYIIELRGPLDTLIEVVDQELELKEELSRSTDEYGDPDIYTSWHFVSGGLGQAPDNEVDLGCAHFDFRPDHLTNVFLEYSSADENQPIEAWCQRLHEEYDGLMIDLTRKPAGETIRKHYA